MTRTPTEHHAPVYAGPSWPNRQGRFLWWVAAVLVTVIVASVTVIVLGLTGTIGARYEATIKDLYPVGPAQVAVTLSVHNVSSRSGEPTCQIDVNSPQRAAVDLGFSGTASYRATRALAPGGWTEYRGIVPVTAGPADNVEASVSRVHCR